MGRTDENAPLLVSTVEYWPPSEPNLELGTDADVIGERRAVSRGRVEVVVTIDPPTLAVSCRVGPLSLWARTANYLVDPVDCPRMDDSAIESGDLLGNVLLPVAHEDDAVKTARALEPDDPDAVTVLHVVEKGGGVPDKSPVELSEEMAADAFAAVREVFPEADDHTADARNVVDAIFDAADEVDASAIAYRSRGGNRLLQFLSGDRSLKLVTRARRPVIALPVEE